jgi:Ran GTPase-activating protein (RanGAP) involved in mRNA processing and transport
VPQLEELLASKAKLTCLNFAGVPLGELAPANSIEKAVGLGGMTVPPSVAEPNVALLCDRIIASNVTLVKLYDTKLSDAAAIVVASMLRSALGVAELSLRCNQISDLGTTAIANAVALHDSLMSLDLSMNMVQDAGATALANALTTSTSLRSLELGYNTIGSEGGISISESLRGQSTLTRLGLGNNLLK